MPLKRSTEPHDWLYSVAFIRALEEHALTLRRQELVSGSIHVCVGQETAPVVAAGVLDQRDRVISTYRGHGWALASGVPPMQLMSELLGRGTGTNGGRGGSPYLSAPEYGFIGENSIVGAGAPIANGVAMGLRAAGEGGVCVVAFGDGATNQGAVHEAMVFAVARNLPVIFVCENNGWSEMTPISATVPHVSLEQRAAGYGINTRVASGSDLSTMHDVFADVVERARRGDGPSFVEVHSPRLLGHYSGDIEHYRSAEDRASAAARDPLKLLAAQLADQSIDERGRVDAIIESARAAADEAVQIALSQPLPSAESALAHITAAKPPAFASADASGAKEELTYAQAVNRALISEMSERPEVVTFGEDIAIPGGTFGVTRNLYKTFGEERAFDTPIAEAAILGAALGASLEGLRPVVEIMWTDFLFVAFDQVVNQMSNVRYLSRGSRSAPLVVRMQQGITPGSCAQHSQSLEALLAHIPGIKVGLPSDAQDAYAMLRAAVADPDPVFIIESRALYGEKAAVDLGGATEAVGGARLLKQGHDLLIVTWGRMARTALRAAEQLEASGVSASVLDLRWLSPLDDEAIGNALKSSGGRLLVAHEANLTGGFGAEVAARAASKYFWLLDAPVARVAMPDVRVPASPTLQEAILPNAEWIVRGAMGLVGR
ncbi:MULTISPECIES: alpha-ketoacid dehydrogenase subunit alpha/beta [Microbacterium]|uniref:alpha-ketoacid dehydrogenase subunit alpha/beta n=1 Tax=Microbacterium TaxID=33882 RepID=UPI001469AD62|nr:MULTISPECIES: alpha-ketoacid dehydrogenase subunit alpha/beta [Microbacterium]